MTGNDEGRVARSFINDTNGIILQQSSGDANAPTSITRQIVANGQVYGSYGFAQPSGTLTHPAINFNNLPPGMVLSASTYDASFQPINSGYPSASIGSYLVQTGDTRQSIAQSAYGDRQLWFVIAQANGLMSDADLKVGMSLTIPSKVGSVHNTSDTFKPYNPGELIGDTAPTLPVPPVDSDDGCGALGMIIMIVVAVVVTVATSGAAAGVWGSVLGAGSTAATVAGAATAAALGSIASQVVGNALGIVDGFSWKAVALAAIAGGVGGGVDAAFGGAASGLGDTVLRAVIKNAITQGIGVATGLQDSFDWRGVAAAGIGAGVGFGVGNVLGNSLGTDTAGRIATQTITGLASGIASAAARGGKVSIGNIAADAFGNALGGAFVDNMTSDRNPSNANYRNEMDRESDAYRPQFNYNYRNQMDIDSDNANATNNPPAYTGGNDFANDVARRKQENAWWNNAASGKDKQIEEVSKPEDSSTALIRNEPPAPRSVRAGDFGGSLERIARSELGSGASQREINNYVGQLFEINGISNARRIGENQGILLPGADTPNATSGLSQYGKDIVIGERIKEQARAEAEFKRQQAAQEAQASTSQGMGNDEAYAMYMASGGRSGSYARAMGSGYVPTYSAGASYGAVSGAGASSASYDALGNMTGISPEFGGYAGGDASDSYGARVVRAGVGIVETVGAGAYNSVVRIAGGAASAAVWAGSGFDVGAGVAVQEGIKQSFGYTPQSAGARDVAQALAPVGAAINSASNSVRAFSESYIGDGATTIVGATLQAGLEIAGVVTGLRGIQRAVGDVAFGLPDTSNMLYGSLGGIPIKATYISPSLIGDGSALARAMGGVPEGYQAHHLVMSSIAKDSPALQYLAKQGLYDVNRSGNGLALPGSEFLALADDLPLHRGFHGYEYRKLVEKELMPLNTAFKSGVGDAALMRQVGRIESNIQQRLLSGNVYLNAADAALRQGR